MKNEDILRDTVAHCDNCGHDEPMPLDKAKEFIGKKCPQCSTVMITENDYTKIG